MIHVKNVLNRLFATSYGQTFLVFLASQFAFLAVAKWEWAHAMAGLSVWLSPERIITTQTAFFLFSVHVLVTFNTFAFLRHMKTVTKHEAKLTDANQKLTDKMFRIIHRVYLFSVFISGALAMLYGSILFSSSNSTNWIKDLRINEVCLIILFSLFVYANIRLLQMCDVCIGDVNLDAPGKASVGHFRDSAVRFLWACDVPGLVGIVMIAVFSLVVSFENPQLKPNFIELQHYLHGFFVGAIGLHMLFSQAVLAFLSEPD